MEAVATFNEAGIPSGVLIAPLMPGINDDPEQVEEIVALAEEAGATFVNGIALHLRPGVREVFMSWLSAARPDLVPRYEELYERGAYAPPAERKRISRLIRAFNRSARPPLRAPRRARRQAGRAPRAGATARPGQPLLGESPNGTRPAGITTFPSRKVGISATLPDRIVN